MKRRAFITLLGGAAAAWPLAARAQQTALPVIGFLHTRSPEADQIIEGFRQGLAETDYVVGRNVAIEYRWALGQYERLPALAADLVRRQVAVLVGGGGYPSALAAKTATSTIPVVFTIGNDPVGAGLVASYNRPGGNMTGITIWTEMLGTKRLGLLHEMVPQAATIGLLANPRFAPTEGQLRDAQEAARGLRVGIHVLLASTDSEIEASFESIARERIAALAVGADPFFDTRREKLVAMAARYAVPTMYQFREFAVAGGLMSYGTDQMDVWRQIGVYTGRILKGQKPSDLPVMQPAKFELVINLKTANALGLEVPPTLLARADEVIE
jgi:putative tryptophan/tyrosine transport system substrate-binding protein